MMPSNWNTRVGVREVGRSTCVRAARRRAEVRHRGNKAIVAGAIQASTAIRSASSVSPRLWTRQNPLHDLQPAVRSETRLEAILHR